MKVLTVMVREGYCGITGTAFGLRLKFPLALRVSASK
jgi:hypothetical protein